jgi:hypothetical protein
MPATLRDRIAPTAVGLVSRAWVIDAVERRPELDADARARAIEALVAYEPPRRHPVRDNAIFWIGALGAAGIADAFGAPGWAGFVAALIGFALLARALAVRALRWRLDRLIEEIAAYRRGGG